MALVKCKECSNQISTTAKACPVCGAKVKKRVGVLGWIFVLVIILPVAVGIGQSINDDSKQARQNAAQSLGGGRSSSWTYGDFKDDMTDKVSKWASLKSPDQVHFDFPYNGGSTLELTYRKRSDGREDAFFQISKGQILCSSYSCPVSLRIGDGPVQTFKGSSAAAGKSDVVFLGNLKELRAALTSGTPFKVQIEFFQKGNVAFGFDPKGFKPL